MSIVQGLPPALAPWGEVIPSDRPMTVDDLLVCPDEGYRYELVEVDKPYPFAPDLAIEVDSPLQKADAMAAKALRYLRGGTTVVWIVWTEEQKVDVWRPGDHRPSSTLTEGDQLDGEQVVPGFACPVAGILGLDTRTHRHGASGGHG